MTSVLDSSLQFAEIETLQSQQRYVDAEKLCHQRLEKSSSESIDLAVQLRLRSYLFASLEAQARYAEAQNQLEVAQSILSDVSASYPAQISLPLKLDWLVNQGTLARVQGDYIQAECCFKTAIQLAETQGYSPDSFSVKCLNNLAIVYKYWGRFEAADTLYQALLADLIQQQRESCLEVATIYHNLGGLYHAQRRYTDAEPYARQSYQLHLDLLGPDHGQTVADGAALGAILHGLGQWDEAILYFEAAITFFEQQFGPVHYEIAINLNNLAASLQAKGDFEQAESAYRRTLVIKEALLGSEHPDIAISLNNLASLLQKTGNYVESAELFERAIAVFDATVGPDHPNTQLCRENAANVPSTSSSDSGFYAAKRH